MAVVAFCFEYPDRNRNYAKMKRQSNRHMYVPLSEEYTNRLSGEPRFILRFHYKKQLPFCQQQSTKNGQRHANRIIHPHLFELPKQTGIVSVY